MTSPRFRVNVVSLIAGVIMVSACAGGGGTEAAPAEPLSVAEAVDVDDGTMIVVRGIVGDAQGDFALCDGGEDSQPLSCVGDVIRLDGVSTLIVADLAYRPRRVTMSGALTQGTLTVESLQGGLDCTDCRPLAEDLPSIVERVEFLEN